MRSAHPPPEFVPGLPAPFSPRARPVWSALSARSGAASKRIEHGDPKDFGDEVRPFVVTLIDLMASGDRSVVVFESMTPCTLDRGKPSPTSFGR